MPLPEKPAPSDAAERAGTRARRRACGRRSERPAVSTSTVSTRSRCVDEVADAAAAAAILVYMIASTVLLTARLSRSLAPQERLRARVPALLAASATGSGTQLILWRIQGVGGAFLFADSAALVTDAFPKKELGLAMGTNVMIAAVGLVMRPLGGALIAISWHWVLLVQRAVHDRLDLGRTSCCREVEPRSGTRPRPRRNLGLRGRLTGRVLGRWKGCRAGAARSSSAARRGRRPAAVFVLVDGTDAHRCCSIWRSSATSALHSLHQPSPASH